MARKTRQLMQDPADAGVYEIRGAGKGLNRKFTHARYPGAVTLSGKPGDDAEPYQEKQVQRALEGVLT
jgi:hypothetical protein